MVCVSLGRMVEMTMIEMRWVEKTTELRIPFSVLSYTDIEKVLQYRQQVDQQWSNWIDVRMVKE